MPIPSLNKESIQVRQEFVKTINSLPWNNRLRTDAESLLIMYDQLLERHNDELELIAVLKQYIELLGAELGELVTLAHNHGWKSKYIQEGIELRERIEQLENKHNPLDPGPENKLLF